MDKATLLANLDFSRGRLLGILDDIEKSGHDVQKVLGWRPAPGRAHIAWQAMHCAATHDRYVNVRFRGATLTDPELVEHFAGGSTPSDDHVPPLAVIRQKLKQQYDQLTNCIAPLDQAGLARTIVFGDVTRSIEDTLLMIAWHEAHHQGQIHLTWKMYKAAVSTGV